LQRWLARYRAGGLAGLGQDARADRGRSRFPEPLRLLAEGLALRTPAPSAAQVHRQVTEVAEREGATVVSGYTGPASLGQTDHLGFGGVEAELQSLLVSPTPVGLVQRLRGMAG
jgi:putative transposase